MKKQSVIPRVTDVILLIPKKVDSSLCLEFKTATGQQSDEQKEFQRQAEMYRSKYVIVRVEELQRIKDDPELCHL